MAMDNEGQRTLLEVDEIVDSNRLTAVHVVNGNKNTNNLAGIFNLVKNHNHATNTVLVLNIHSDTSSEQTRAILAQIDSTLAARSGELGAAPQAITVGEAQHTLIGRVLDERPAPDDYVRSIALPWMHKLKPVWGFILDSLSQISEPILQASSASTVAAAVGFGLFVGQNGGIPAACTAGTLALFALGNPYGFFRSPDIPHCIIVVDFFDNEVPVPVSEASSSTALHRALTRHLDGKIVLVLLEQHKYELRAIEVTPGSTVLSGRTLPAQGWTDLLQPGSKLSMNALVSMSPRHDSSQVVCPACSSTFVAEECTDHSDWLQCRRCPSKIWISASEDDPSRSFEEESDVDSTSGDLSDKEDVNGSAARQNREHPTAILEQAVSQCRRIRVIEQSNSRDFSPEAAPPARAYEKVGAAPANGPATPVTAPRPQLHGHTASSSTADDLVAQFLGGRHLGEASIGPGRTSGTPALLLFGQSIWSTELDANSAPSPLVGGMFPSPLQSAGLTPGGGGGFGALGLGQGRSTGFGQSLPRDNTSFTPSLSTNQHASSPYGSAANAYSTAPMRGRADLFADSEGFGGLGRIHDQLLAPPTNQQQSPWLPQPPNGQMYHRGWS